jgi:uncharacterized repeat protein (TIGR03809 family)
MTHRQDVAYGRDIALRWCALAEQRLQHLTELFESGRWRRFHSERAFLENIQEAKRAVQVWRDLSTPEGARKCATAGMGWPAPAPTPLPSNVPSLQTVQPKSVQIAAETSVPVTVAAALSNPVQTSQAELGPYAEFALPDDDPPEPPAVTPRVVEFTLKLDGIEARYPLLRNVF